MSTQNADNVAITGGSINGTTIGASSPSTGAFTTLIGGGGSANYAQITGGATTKAVQFQTIGTDTNISQVFQPKGTGAIDLAAGSSGVNISNGGTVTAISRTAAGSGYTSVPSAVISAPTTAGGVQATFSPVMQVATSSLATAGSGYAVNNVLTVVGGTFTSAATFTVNTVDGSGAILTYSLTSSGAYTVLPTSPVSVTGGAGTSATFNLLTYTLAASGGTITNAGSGYVEQPTVTFSGGGGSGAAAYATVGSGTVVRSIGTTMSFYTPGGEQARIDDTYSGGTAVNYVRLRGRAAGAGPIVYVGGSDTNTTLNLASAGTGSVTIGTNSGGTTQMQIANTASAVNYVQVTGAATTSAPIISAQGSDANVTLQYVSKGTGQHIFATRGGTGQFRILDTASAVNYATVTGSAAGAAPVFSVAGTDTNISQVFQPKGTGAIDLAAGSSGVNISNGGTVTAITRTVQGSLYTSVPSLAISAPTTAGGVQATAAANLGATAVAIAGGGTGYTVGDTLTIVGGTGTAAQLTVGTVSSGVITAVSIAVQNGVYSVFPTSPVSVTGGTGSGATFNISGGILSTFTITNAGSGYVEQPTVTFSGGGGSGAAAYAAVGSGTVVRSLGSSLSFYTPGGEQFRVFDTGATADAYIAFKGATSTTGGTYITNTGTARDLYVSAGVAKSIRFFTNGEGIGEQLRVSPTASAVNYVQVTGAATTSAPIISAQGSDANIDLSLTPKGTGLVRFGTYTAGAPTATGYINIKTSDGTTYKLLVST
jgi:hypothetical protein